MYGGGAVEAVWSENQITTDLASPVLLCNMPIRRRLPSSTHYVRLPGLLQTDASASSTLHDGYRPLDVAALNSL